MLSLFYIHLHAWLGQKAAFYASVRETNRRPFGARCGGDLLWIILDNQHP
ncbi:hypothetical protein P4S91_21085 [Aneurinibacillus aneurinilyticus]|jgi:hypothetical protein|nr:hypothetical protein [Aneurinibacillus aneurinilyticus]MCI1694449.1 hypothetical protein [Aneurinibacillus aneurinilyticus]MED0705347.1 hypothetical protein [Aneurinibacillus aneurinilyticus]MED0725392.1 hypothetical protein [Aneurinibacillus aneurinilyticus]MED0741796.1 hypothetical protein [Aneurinibacillus aneurinilyticus]